MDFLKVEGISKQQEGAFVLKNISFTQQKLQKIAIAGETGSGKSTLLKVIAGLAQPDEGEVFFENVRIEGPAEKLIPGHPGIAYLSQHFELPNNYRVEEVLEYANKLSDEEANNLYEVCHISHLVKRRTNQVSGGEKQRIALARILITSPKLLLLDEPYSNLDMIHKSILKTVIRDIGEKLGISCMLISHDPLDTLSWADEIMVMKSGQIVQTGSPKEVYREPVSEYVAGLFGNYSLLVIDETVTGFRAKDGNGKKLFLRPEAFILTETGVQKIQGQVKQVIFMGSNYDVEVQIPGNTIIIRTAECNFKKGDVVTVALKEDTRWYL